VFWLQRFCALTTALRRFRAADPGLSASPRGWSVGCAAQTGTQRTWWASGFDDWTPQTCLSSPALAGRWPRALPVHGARFAMSGWSGLALTAPFMPFVALCRPRRAVLWPGSRGNGF
jgi:hypothetical protein